MQQSDENSLIPIPIASQAASGNVATIPTAQATAGDGRVSIDLGYPPECAISVAAGGKYPEMQDANGVYNLLSSAIRSIQAWGVLPFNASFATGIGGYPKYAVCVDSSGDFWVSTADANTTVPGTTGATWQSLFNGYATEAWANGLFATITQLQAEASARASADTQLQANITSEASARANADTALQANITQETAARVAADALNAKLTGGNAFTGSQTVAGSVTATGGQLLATQSSDATMRAVLYASSAVAQFALQSISGSTSSTLGYLNISSAGVVTTSLGTVALTSQLPFTDTTKKLQSFTVTVNSDVSREAQYVPFPVSFASGSTPVVFCQINRSPGGDDRVATLENNPTTSNAPSITNAGFYFRSLIISAAPVLDNSPYVLQVFAQGVF